MTVQKNSGKTRPLYKPTVVGFGLAITTVAIAVMAPIGSRVGWWNYDFASQILRWTVYGGTLAAVVCLVGTLKTLPRSGRRGFLLGLFGLIVLIPTVVLPAYWNYSKQKLPPIQDITTDTENPPDFWFAPASHVYGGPALAALQREAYPDIEPVFLHMPVTQAFDHALDVVREMGWELLASNRGEGRIEAADTTFWFGFKDDVVVRVMEVDGGSRIDVRSASRFGGGGDIGANANRIRAFFRALKRRTSEEAR